MYIGMNIKKNDKEAIEGMALYVEECMNEVRKQLIRKDVQIDIVRVRAARAAGTTEVLMQKLKGMA